MPMPSRLVLRSAAFALLLGGSLITLTSAHAAVLYTGQPAFGGPPATFINLDEPAVRPMPPTPGIPGFVPADQSRFPVYYYPAPTPSAPSPLAKKMEQKVEMRINTLHERLKITPAQEPAWAPVAAAMRGNQAEVGALIESRRAAKTSGMTAVESLESYQRIAQAHANGLRNVIAPFAALYSTLSAEQRKTADTLFSRKGFHDAHRGKPGKHAKPASQPSTPAPAPAK